MITEAETVRQQWVRLDGEDHDTTIDGYEVAAARRALALLKTSLGRERLLDLLQPEIAAGETFLRTHVELSAGHHISGTTTLRAQGISAAEFNGWLLQAFGREDVLLAGHPEHYAIHAAGGRVNIVETLGDHVCSFFMQPWDEAVISGVPQQVATDVLAPITRRSRMLLEDGTVVGSIANVFCETDDGFTAELSVTLPASCGREVIDHHLQHFAVEFHSWILAAASELTSPDRT